MMHGEQCSATERFADSEEQNMMSDERNKR